MSSCITEEDLKHSMREQTDEIVGVIQSFVQQMVYRFNKIETRLDYFDKK